MSLKLVASRINLSLLTLLFLASTLFAGTEGLVAFSVNRNLDPAVSIASEAGNICDLTSDSVGTFEVVFCSEEPDVYYQIIETDDSGPIDREIRSRSVSGFTLYIKENGVAADPQSLCIVTISRAEPDIAVAR